MSGFEVKDLQAAVEAGGMTIAQQARALMEIEALQVALRQSRHIALVREQRIKELLPGKIVCEDWK